MKLWLQKAWICVKQYWLYVVLFVSLVAVVVFGSYKKDNYDKLLNDYQQQRDSYRRQLQQLQEVREQEQREHARIEEEYRKLIEKLRQEFQEGLVRVAETRRDEITAIMTRTKDDPGAMTRELNELFGIPIYQ